VAGGPGGFLVLSEVHVLGHSTVNMTMRYYKADLTDQVTATEKLPTPVHPGQHLVSIHCGGERPGVAADGSELQSDAKNRASRKS
jgi:hypothetical protein